MKKFLPFAIIALLSFAVLTPSVGFSQSVGINKDGTAPDASAMLDVKNPNKGILIPRVALTGTGDITTIQSPATSLMVYNTTAEGTGATAVIPGYYYWDGAKWNRLSTTAGSTTTTAGSLVVFSSGIIRSGPTMVSAAPLLLGFGNSTVEVINGLGEPTSPPEVGGFSFVVPSNGVIQNLQVSSDLLAASTIAINTVGLQYDFTVFRSSSSPNNGIDHDAMPYVTTSLATSLRFGFPSTIISAGSFRSATNINPGVLQVQAGDRIGIRVRTIQSTDPAAADITQLSFSASFTYTAQ
jgi:hypothetical protein